MKQRLALFFPYLFLILIAAFILWGERKSDVVMMDAAYAASSMQGEGDQQNQAHIDPVCKMEVGERIALQYHQAAYFFCSEHCRTLFQDNPQRYLADVCLVCKAKGVYTPVRDDSAYTVTWQNQTYRFCSLEHQQAFRQDPAGFFMHTMWGIPNELYYASIAIVLILSFGIFEWRAKHLLPATRPRWNLLQYTWLQRLVTHPLTRFILQLIFVAFFLLIIAAGLFGNQLPSKNIAPILTWTVWWGGLILLVAYLGKAWCYVCPWDALSDWAEGLRFWGKKKEPMSLGLSWPPWMRNIWPATILFVLLTWIELGFGVTMNPRATAWLALAMLLLAFVSVFIFDRKSFCRYGCLVGRISGLYALFAPVEIRARDHWVCRSCKTQSCFKGNSDGEPCPTFEHLSVMKQNTYCISCMECVKTCEKKNVAFQLRPWGEDLVTHHRPRSDEAYLSLIMLSLTGFHGLTMTPNWRAIKQGIESLPGMTETLAFTLGMAAVMIAPVILYALLVGCSWWISHDRTVSYKDYFIRYAYALLPIALFYHLAHNSEHLLMEGQKVIALLSDPFGYEWNLFGTAQWQLEPLLSLSTLWIIQVFCVMVGHVYSLWIANRTAGKIFSDSRTALRSQVPMLIAMIVFSLVSLWLLKQPMEMRTSAM